MPRKNDWQIDTKWLDGIDRDVKRGAQSVCEETAAKGLEVAQAAVPELSGSLRESGYVKTPRRSGYWAAVGAARAQPNSRVGIRDQILPELSPPQRDGQKAFAWAAFDFPLLSGVLIQGGFFHVRTKRQIPAFDFIALAETEVESDFQRAMRAVLFEAIRRHRPRRK